jgi:uroporphyrinogen decarboxylase
LCLTPEWAAEITLQPIKRFDFDAAILFADILLVPHALGQKLEFREGEGPVLRKIESEKDIAALKFDNNKLAPVYETLTRVKKELPGSTALIGFCGSPWTVAAYMIDGTSRKNFSEAKQWAAEHPERLEKLISVLIDTSEKYLCAQIKAGAEVLQLFDSWAGLLKGEDFARWVIDPTRELVARIKRAHPAIPIIGFPREAGGGYYDYVRQTGIDALSIDQHVELIYAKRELQGVKPLQGNLAPELLVRGGDEMKKALAAIMDALGPAHIINLGHGVVPETRPENVAELVKFVRDYRGPQQ